MEAHNKKITPEEILLLSNKQDQWFAITLAALKTGLSQNSFIVGEATRCLLLGEKINDIDLIVDVDDSIAMFNLEQDFNLALKNLQKTVSSFRATQFPMSVSKGRPYLIQVDIEFEGTDSILRKVTLQAKIVLGLADNSLAAITNDASNRDFTVNKIYLNNKRYVLLTRSRRSFYPSTKMRSARTRSLG